MIPKTSKEEWKFAYVGHIQCTCYDQMCKHNSNDLFEHLKCILRVFVTNY
jgi:hypothetical protein